MRAVIQRVSSASVKVNNEVRGQIDQGLLVLLGIEADDVEEDVNYLVKKLIAMRIFSDDDGKMNLSVGDISGGILLVSQFTLFASTKKGNRPGYSRAAPPSIAIPLYERFAATLKANYNGKVEMGVFGADMQVELLNDGPVTIIIDTKNKE